MWTPRRRSRGSGRFPSRCTAGRATTCGGFEKFGGELGGGIAATGNYPGSGPHARRTARRRRQGPVADPGPPPLQPARHLRRVRRRDGRARRDPARALRGLDRLGEVSSASASTSTRRTSRTRRRPTASRCRTRDEGIRDFWIEHGIACRKIGEAMGRALGSPCVTNVWIPDGMKDTPVDRVGAARAADRGARRDLRRADRSRRSTSTRSRASCSASARRATSSARTSSTWATR